VLIVDCHECPRPQDLSDHNCLRGVLNLIASDPSGLREVMLSRDWEIVYDGECVTVLDRLCEVIRFCNGLSYQQLFDDCSTCRSNPSLVISRVVDALPQAAPDLDDASHTRSGGHGRACEQCARSLRSNLDHARALLSQGEDLANKTAYRVVTGNEH
jgi:hypothetical protein